MIEQEERKIFGGCCDGDTMNLRRKNTHILNLIDNHSRDMGEKIPLKVKKRKKTWREKMGAFAFFPE